jgi:predicted SAM-dependent methyltransferase
LKELYRLLKTGGVMNFSIPQMPHRDQTAEWIIPDESHHGHVVIMVLISNNF